MSKIMWTVEEVNSHYVYGGGKKPSEIFSMLAERDDSEAVCSLLLLLAPRTLLLAVLVLGKSKIMALLSGGGFSSW